MNVGTLRKVLDKVSDDFEVDVTAVKEVSDEELANRSYKLPYDYLDGIFDFNDISYSEKTISFHLELE